MDNNPIYKASEQKRIINVGEQTSSQFLGSHQQLKDIGENAHWEIDDFIREYKYKATRYVKIKPVRVLNLTNQSDIAETDLDLSAYTTPRTYAVNIRLILKDNASATSRVLLIARDEHSWDHVYLTGNHLNNAYTTESGTCSCDKNQIIKYYLNASGAGTADIMIDLYGYFEGIWRYQEEE